MATYSLENNEGRELVISVEKQPTEDLGRIGSDTNLIIQRVILSLTEGENILLKGDVVTFRPGEERERTAVGFANPLLGQELTTNKIELAVQMLAFLLQQEEFVAITSHSEVGTSDLTILETLAKTPGLHRANGGVRKVA